MPLPGAAPGAWPKPAAWIAATPGRFCEAMVTTNSGKARLTAASSVKTGATNTGVVKEKSTLAPVNPWVLATNTIAASKVSGTA